MSIMKKFISFFSIFILLIGIFFNINVFANENKKITYEEFKQAQLDGYIGETMTYEDLNKFIELSYQLEEKMENSKDFYKVYDSRRVALGENIPLLEPGDILITNGTTVPYLPGHAAIAVSDKSILHIAGKGETPTKESRYIFKDMYIKRISDWIKIYRPKNSYYGKKAAEWADATYGYGPKKYAKYVLDNDLYSTDKTYCSKIVWQAYRFGLEKSESLDAFDYVDSSQHGTLINAYYMEKGPIPPYILDSLIKSTFEYKVVSP